MKQTKITQFFTTTTPSVCFESRQEATGVSTAAFESARAYTRYASRRRPVDGVMYDERVEKYITKTEGRFLSRLMVERSARVILAYILDLLLWYHPIKKLHHKYSYTHSDKIVFNTYMGYILSCSKILAAHELAGEHHDTMSGIASEGKLEPNLDLL